MSGDVGGFLGALVRPMREHLAELDGDTGGAATAAEDFGSASTALTEIGGRHSAAATAALDTWYGDRSAEFGARVGTFSGAVTTLAANCATARDVAASAVAAVRAGRTTIEGLIDEFVARAEPVLAAALSVSLLSGPGAALIAAANASALADEYSGRTAAEVQRVREELTALVARLDGMAAVDTAALAALGEPLGAASSGDLATSGTTTPSQGRGSAGETSGTGSGSGSGDGSGSGGGGGGGGGAGGGGGGGGATGPRLPVAIPPQPGEGVGVNLPDGSSAEAPNETAARAVRNALSALGTPYVWGAANPPSGTDCSGLTSWAYAGAGFDVPRPASSQAMGASVPPDQLLPGDLVVWDGHVAMVIGNGQMVEAGDPVQVNPIRTDNIGMGFTGFYRPTG